MVEVPVTKVLHLKSAVTALPDGTIVGYQPLVDDPSLFPCFLSVPEAHGCAVVVLDSTSVRYLPLGPPSRVIPTAVTVSP